MNSDYAYKRMWLGIIIQAVHDYYDHSIKDRVSVGIMYREEATRWLFEDSEEHNGFLSICEMFGIDPHNIRKTVLKYTTYKEYCTGMNDLRSWDTMGDF